MTKQSAGLLMYRTVNAAPEVLLVHPGGPFWSKKDKAVWTIPKGEFQLEEDPLKAAQREFQEETGFPTHPPFHPLGTLRQSAAKQVTAWAFAGDCDPTHLRSNVCQIQWPPRSGKLLEIPEVDRAAWFTLPTAADYILPTQHPFLTTFATLLTTL